MLSTTLPPRMQAAPRIFFQLKKMIATEIDLLDASSKLGVTLSTLQKILAGGPVSLFIRKKIGRALAGKELSVPPRRRSNIERMLEVHRLYQERRTLRGVAKKIGLSHERVRQLLVKGSEFGLFEYNPSREIDLPRETILADYGRLLTLKGVAQVNRLSLSRLQQILKAHRITDFELKAIWITGKKGACASKYDAVVRELGRHPTATELQRLRATRSLTAQIRRLWGSMEAFRRDRGISPPSRGSVS